jgi:hypothetical protein
MSKDSFENKYEDFKEPELFKIINARSETTLNLNQVESDKNKGIIE